jgi:SAM-dependent methyltransferase
MMYRQRVTRFGQRVVQFVQKLVAGTPVQRRDARYQLRMHLRRIDLTGNTLEDLGLSRERSESHSNSGGPSLEVVLDSLNISEKDALLDMGCGKGGAMITLAKYPFRRIDGVEICPSLIEIAQHNLGRLNCLRGTITQCDAAEYTHFDAYNFLYMFNPFPAVVMDSVLQNLRPSLQRVPRKVTLIYNNPVCHDTVIAHGFRQVKQFDHTLPPFRIYENVSLPQKM